MRTFDLDSRDGYSKFTEYVKALHKIDPTMAFQCYMDHFDVLYSMYCAAMDDIDMSGLTADGIRDAFTRWQTEEGDQIMSWRAEAVGKIKEGQLVWLDPKPEISVSEDLTLFVHVAEINDAGEHFDDDNSGSDGIVGEGAGDSPQDSEGPIPPGGPDPINPV